MFSPMMGRKSVFLNDEEILGNLLPCNLERVNACIQGHTLLIAGHFLDLMGAPAKQRSLANRKRSALNAELMSH